MFFRKQPVVKACEHLWEQAIPIANGQFAQKCMRCGECKGVVIPCNHIWSDPVNVSPGHFTQSCKQCNQTRGVEVPCNHVWALVEGNLTGQLIVQQCQHCKILDRKEVECKHEFEVIERFKYKDQWMLEKMKLVNRCKRCGTMNVQLL